jgi:hypothetical protein
LLESGSRDKFPRFIKGGRRAMKDKMRTVLVCAAVLAVGLAATAGASKLITGGQIKNGSIGLADLSKSAKRALKGQTGQDGAQGPTGPQGPAGPAGVNAILRVSSPTVSIPSGSSSYDVEQVGGPALIAACPAGQVVSGTGLNNSIGYVGFVLSFGDFVGGFIYNDSSITIDVTVQAMCVPGSAAGTTTATQAKQSFERAAARQDARLVK